MPSKVPSRPHLFLDDTWVADSAFVTRVWHQALKFPDPVLRAEHPWELWAPVTYGTVLRQGGLFRMWYTPWTRKAMRSICYAESDDGVRWRKPALGLVDFQGSTRNNILLMAREAGHFIDDLAVIDDPADERWPLKMLYWESSQPGIHAARSRDGLKWERLPGPVLPWGDRFNAVSQRVDGKFVAFGRTNKDRALRGRCVWRAESEDLRHWSKPALAMARDAEDPVDMEHYSLVPFMYEGAMMGGLERMHMSPDKIDTEIVWSPDLGRTWRRSRTRPRFISWGHEGSWDSTWINLPANAPIVQDGQLWFYYSGRSAAHRAVFPQTHGCIGLSFLRIDGFASMAAQVREGWLLTPPFQWPGGDLYLNVDCRRDLLAHPGFCHGHVLVEVRDARNRPLKGYARADALAFTGNTRALPNACDKAAWQGGRSLAALRGRKIRLCFYMKDAHLYSFRAGTAPKPDPRPGPGEKK